MKTQKVIQRVIDGAFLAYSTMSEDVKNPYFTYSKESAHKINEIAAPNAIDKIRADYPNNTFVLIDA